MDYYNAEDLFPKEVLQKIKKYAAGKMVYFPKNEEEKSKWGMLSGQKLYYRKRNQMICNEFLYGVSVVQLAEKYHLSVETIKKIVYSKKNQERLSFCPDVESAMEYEKETLIEEWIHTYLLFERKNKGFSDGLKKQKRYYLGPVAMPIHLLKRNSGPEEGMKWKVHKEVFETRVQNWEKKMRQEEAMPPIIAEYKNSQFEINCNTPLFEALLRNKISYYPIILWCSSEEEYKLLKEKYRPSLI